MNADDLNRVEQSFRTFASERAATPPVYERLASYVADHPDILRVFESLPAVKQRPVTLFAAVHYLVLKGTDHPLARDYQAGGGRDVLERVGDHFADFVDEHFDDLVRTMSERNVQTNEVNRCAALVPALMTVEREAAGPLALVELGASAGLNLLFDRFRYDYANGPAIGPPGASVRCHCEIRGVPPRFSGAMPEVDFRLGVDTEPVDLGDEDEVLWLRACVWVGDVAREQRLTAAIELARREWPPVRPGDAIELLPRIVDEVPDGLDLVLFNSWMMSWMPDGARARLDEVVRTVAARRPLWWITFEWPTKVPAFAATSPSNVDCSLLGLQRVTSAGVEARKLADVAHHGNWIEWTDTPSQRSEGQG